MEQTKTTEAKRNEIAKAIYLGLLKNLAPYVKKKVSELTFEEIYMISAAIATDMEVA